MKRTSEEKQLQAARQSVFEETENQMNEVADYYGLPRADIEERIKEKARKVLEAATLSEAQELSKKAIDCLHTACLVLAYYSKRIPGPRTPEALEKKAKKAESLAKFQESRGNDEAAAKQRARAEKLKNDAKELRAEPAKPAKVITRKHLKVKAKKERHRTVRTALQGALGGAMRRGLFRSFW